MPTNGDVFVFRQSYDENYRASNVRIRNVICCKEAERNREISMHLLNRYLFSLVLALFVHATVIKIAITFRYNLKALTRGLQVMINARSFWKASLSDPVYHTFIIYRSYR